MHRVGRAAARAVNDWANLHAEPHLYLPVTGGIELPDPLAHALHSADDRHRLDVNHLGRTGDRPLATAAGQIAPAF